MVKHLFPSLCGVNNETVFYASTVSAEFLMSRVVQTSEDYSELAKDFCGIVILCATVVPLWYSIGIDMSQSSTDTSDLLSEKLMDSIGYLGFSGEEKLYIIQGKKAFENRIQQALLRNEDISAQEIPVIFVGKK